MPCSGLERRRCNGWCSSLLPFESGDSCLTCWALAGRIFTRFAARIAKVWMWVGRRGHHETEGNSDQYYCRGRSTIWAGGTPLRRAPWRLYLCQQGSGRGGTRSGNSSAESKPCESKGLSCKEASLPRAATCVGPVARGKTSCERDDGPFRWPLERPAALMRRERSRRAHRKRENPTDKKLDCGTETRTGSLGTLLAWRGRLRIAV